MIHRLVFQKKNNQETYIRKLIKRVLLVSFFSAFITSLLYPQDNRVVFSHLDVNNGLSENWIKCIYKDLKGFIWFGTNSGLNRFDGYKFELFQKSISDSTGISDNAVNAITGDSDGNLWVGTGGGVSILNCETYKFRKVNLLPSAPLLCQDVEYITAMATDHEGNVLIGTHNGLFIFNKKSNTFRHILIDEQSCSSPINNITTITYDKTGSYWIGTIN